MGSELVLEPQNRSESIKFPRQMRDLKPLAKSVFPRVNDVPFPKLRARQGAAGAAALGIDRRSSLKIMCFSSTELAYKLISV